jgi:hypothetical protein
MKTEKKLSIIKFSTFFHVFLWKKQFFILNMRANCFASQLIAKRWEAKLHISFYLHFSFFFIVKKISIFFVMFFYWKTVFWKVYIKFCYFFSGKYQKAHRPMIAHLTVPNYLLSLVGFVRYSEFSYGRIQGFEPCYNFFFLQTWEQISLRSALPLN